MLENLLKKLVEATGGPQAIKIVDVLYGKKDVNEFLIAKKLNLTINQTRNLLYRLLNPGVIYSKRKKDKRKGWYIYYWTLNIPKSLEILEAKLSQEIDELEKQLNSREQKRFYVCKSCGIEVNEERALLNNFSCVECGEVYELSDNSGIINELTKALSQLRSELELVLFEKSKVDLTEKKKLNRKIAKEKADKAAKRAEKRATKKALKEKLNPKEKTKPKSKTAKSKPKVKVVKSKSKTAKSKLKPKENLKSKSRFNKFKSKLRKK